MRGFVLFGLLTLVGCVGPRVQIGGYSSGHASVAREVQGERRGIEVRVIDAGVEMRFLRGDQRLIVEGAQRFRGQVWMDRADLQLSMEDGSTREVEVSSEEIAVTGEGVRYRRTRSDWAVGAVEVIRVEE